MSKNVESTDFIPNLVNQKSIPERTACHPKRPIETHDLDLIENVDVGASFDLTNSELHRQLGALNLQQQSSQLSASGYQKQSSCNPNETSGLTRVSEDSPIRVPPTFHARSNNNLNHKQRSGIKNG